jgi:hypothetical protein
MWDENPSKKISNIFKSCGFSTFPIYLLENFLTPIFPLKKNSKMFAKIFLYLFFADIDLISLSLYFITYLWYFFMVMLNINLHQFLLKISNFHLYFMKTNKRNLEALASPRLELVWK